MTVASQTKTENKSPDDETLIVRVASGDQKAFGLLADRYSGLVFSVAYRMQFNRTAAEDIVQETLLRLWRSAAQWNPEKGASVKTWLCRIATNLCIDYKRKAKPQAPFEDIKDVHADDARTDETVQENETGALVGEALQTLPERQRAALVLFHYEDMSLQEVADAMQTSSKGVENLLYRGRTALRQTLEKHKGVL